MFEPKREGHCAAEPGWHQAVSRNVPASQTAVASSRAGRAGGSKPSASQGVWSREGRQEAQDREESPLKARGRCSRRLGTSEPPPTETTVSACSGSSCSGLSPRRLCPPLCWGRGAVGAAVLEGRARWTAERKSQQQTVGYPHRGILSSLKKE